MTKLELHPVANLFPVMSQEAYEALKEDIRVNGQQQMATTWRGLLVDGRHRIRACEELGVEPDIGELMEDVDPIKYALSENLHRRHLTTNERATVAAKLATLRDGQKKSDEATQNCVAQDDAASLLNVSVRSLQQAKHVLENGSKAVVDAVESDQIKASLAEKFIKACPDKKEQAKVVSKGKAAVLAYVAEHKPSPAKSKSKPAAEEKAKPPVPTKLVQNGLVPDDVISGMKRLFSSGTVATTLTDESIADAIYRALEPDVLEDVVERLNDLLGWRRVKKDYTNK